MVVINYRYSGKWSKRKKEKEIKENFKLFLEILGKLKE